MWPVLLDMTKEESMQNLRCLEIEAFSGVVSALRAQGALDNDKLKVLKDMGSIFHISQERHKAEIRRVVNDEHLNTIAYHVNGEKHCVDEWMEEGRRMIPLVARVAPQTAYSAVADEVADHASKINKTLPLPAHTERKRLPLPSPTHSNSSTSDLSSKNFQFRSNEPDTKKRKVSAGLDNNSLSSYFMGPPKISKIQQIYRQKTKAKQKEQLMKVKTTEMVDYSQPPHQKPHQTFTTSMPTKQQMQIKTATVQQPQNSPKINILQNINVGSTTEIAAVEETVLEKELNTPQPSCSSDTPKINKYPSNLSINKINHVTIKPKPGVSDVQKTIKVSAPRKTLSPKTVTTSTGQKLLVVPSTQSITTSSILQRTLTTIPFKNIRTLDKFKIVPNVNSSSQATIDIQNSSKQKVVTVRTSANKKFSQVQLLNTKGGIKVLPFGGKLLTKNNSNIPSSGYGTNASADDGTQSITSTPVLMSSKPQEQVIVEDESFLNSESLSLVEELQEDKININTVDPRIVPIYNDVTVSENTESNTSFKDGQYSPIILQDSIFDEKVENEGIDVQKSSEIVEDQVGSGEEEMKELLVENMHDSMEQFSIVVEETLGKAIDSQLPELELSNTTN